MPGLFVKSLTSIDFAYACHQRGLVGDSWIVDIELHGELNNEGMVFDFGHVKKTIKARIDELVDHKLLVARQMPGVEIETEANAIKVTWHDRDKREFVEAGPLEAVTLFDAEAVSEAQLKALLEQGIQEILPDNVKEVVIHLYQEPIDGAFYHYVHGLKKHDGHCQRIAHGHRSRIEILRDGARDEQLEKQWASLFRDIYLATQEDIEKAITVDGVHYYQMRYQSGEGVFFLKIPADQVYVLDTDTTIEHIAHHIAGVIHYEEPHANIRVLAYEGVDKGAITDC